MMEESSHDEISDLPDEERASSVILTLRQLVHLGGSLKTQLLQLTADIPPAFIASKSEFSPVMPDFKYLRAPESEDAKLEKSQFLKNLYERANESLGDISSRTFDLLLQVVHYHAQTVTLIEDIENAKFIEDSLERVCQDQERLRMFVEVLYSVGTILLLVDICLPGLLRERLVLAHLRQMRCIHLVQENTMLYTLCQRTGFVPGSRAPQGYPEQYLSKFALPQRVVRFILGLLLQSDIGGVLKHYPNPLHRTTAMSQQGAQTFVLLYFVPDILSKETDFMKQVIDRLFCDRWIISWFPGYTADLRLAWDGYRAARTALRNALTSATRNRLCQQFWEKVDTLCTELERNVKTGGLEAENFLSHSSDIFSLVREANFALRWILLHIFSGDKVPEAIDCETVAKLLLNLSTWELNLLNVYQELLDSRMDRIEVASSLVKENLRILADSCESGEGRSSTMKHDSHVLYWLQCLMSEVEALSSVSERDASEKIRSVQRAFEDIGSFWQLDNSTPSVRTVFKEIRCKLSMIQQLSNVRQELMNTLRIASDFSYGFCLAQHEKFVKILQSIIRKDPTYLEKMGCLLIKMRSILESLQFIQRLPSEGNSISVLGYYENVLRSFGKRVLDHVPECVCTAIDQMAIIRTHVLKLSREGTNGEQLSKIGKVFRQFDNKEKIFHDNSKIYGRLATLSSEIALFSTGLIKVEVCLRDIMSLTLHSNLEDKIRNHVARRLSLLANQKLQFGNDFPPFTFKNVTLYGTRQIGISQQFSGEMSDKDKLTSSLVDLKDYFEGYLRSLECTHDCLDIPGSGLYHSELTRVIAINLRKEYKWMTTGKSGKGSSKRQLSADADSPSTFLGRLAREIVRLTSPGTTHYSTQGCCWLDAGGTEVFGTASVEKLRLSIGVQGLAALDTLFVTRIVKLLKKLGELCMELCTIQTSGQKSISTYSRELQCCRGLSVPMDGAMWYVDAIYSVGTRVWAPIIEVIAAIGQSQLIRRLIGHECRNACMLEAPVAFHRTMQALSECIGSKDMDFISGLRSPDLSHQAASSVASGSSLVGCGKGSDDDTTPIPNLPNRIPARQSEEHALVSEASKKEEVSVQDQDVQSLEASKKEDQETESSRSVADVQKAFDQESSVKALSTIAESASRSFKKKVGIDQTKASHLEANVVDSPNLSSSSIRLSDPGNTAPYGGAARVKKYPQYARYSEASSSAQSEGGSIWDPNAIRRLTRKDVTEHSGIATIGSEASSKTPLLASLDFDQLNCDSSCDLFGSLTSNASAPVMNAQGPPGLFGILQTTGFLDPLTTRYTPENVPVQDSPIILFLATISITHKYEFNKESASLMRPLGSTIPDARSFVTGLVTVLFQYVPSITDQFLRHMGQYVRSYLKTATGATAQGIAAAGVKMVLPQEVERSVAFVCEMCEVGGWSRERAEHFIPPFLLDVWMLGI